MLARCVSYASSSSTATEYLVLSAVPGNLLSSKATTFRQRGLLLTVELSTLFSKFGRSSEIFS
jgi:hypothetical protein